ncbi:MAG: site-2 protease family protein [Chloroflexi bacterium]|nr:site-2 protease family protein [Chloroflexota bacterium]
MRRSGTGIGIGRVLGVRIVLHPSWFVIFALVVLSIVSSVTNPANTGTRQVGAGLAWVIGIVVALLFFTSVLIHELAHALVARRRGLEITEITLFIFGGAANLEQDAPNARTEALVAAAGPVSSLILGGFFLAAFAVLPRGVDATDVGGLFASMAFYLGGANVLLALFNLIPGFPMDGGRLLRALVWGVTGDFLRATRIATLIGRTVAYGMIAIGFFIAINGSVVEGVWLAFIGWFLNQAAEASYRRVAIEKLIEGIRVQDVMDRDVRVVNPNLTLDTLVDQHLLTGQASLYPVTLDGDMLMGTVEIAQVSRIAREDWPNTRVTDIMTRGDAIVTMTEAEALWDAVTRFEESTLPAIAVVDVETRRRLLGLVTRDGVFRALRNRAQLRV